MCLNRHEKPDGSAAAAATGGAQFKLPVPGTPNKNVTPSVMSSEAGAESNWDDESVHSGFTDATAIKAPARAKVAAEEEDEAAKEAEKEVAAADKGAVPKGTDKGAAAAETAPPEPAVSKPPAPESKETEEKPAEEQSDADTNVAVVEESASVVAVADETVKNAGNTRPRRVAILERAEKEKEGKKKKAIRKDANGQEKFEDYFSDSEEDKSKNDQSANSTAPAGKDAEESMEVDEVSLV